MKANQSFRHADQAVSPVIGVILMVAITVVLAAVVFVLVSKLSSNGAANEENASSTVSSNVVQKLTVTLISKGQYGPYTVCTPPGATGCTTFLSGLDMQITVNGLACLTNAAGTGLKTGVTFSDSNVDGKWNPGESFTIDVSNAAFCGASAALSSGSTATVSVIVHSTVIQDNTPVVVR